MNIVVCLAECKLWTLQAVYHHQDEKEWRCHGLPWPGAEREGYEIEGAALTAVGDSALVYAPDYGLVSINLHTSEREVLWKAPPYAGRARWTVPFATSAYKWPCGSSAILLYGGRAPHHRTASRSSAGPLSSATA